MSPFPPISNLYLYVINEVCITHNMLCLDGDIIIVILFQIKSLNELIVFIAVKFVISLQPFEKNTRTYLCCIIAAYRKS